MKANGTEAQKHAVALAYFRTDNSSSVGYILKIHVINVGNELMNLPSHTFTTTKKSSNLITKGN